MSWTTSEQYRPMTKSAFEVIGNEPLPSTTTPVVQKNARRRRLRFHHHRRHHLCRCRYV